MRSRRAGAGGGAPAGRHLHCRSRDRRYHRHLGGGRSRCRCSPSCSRREYRSAMSRRGQRRQHSDVDTNRRRQCYAVSTIAVFDYGGLAMSYGNRTSSPSAWQSRHEGARTGRRRRSSRLEQAVEGRCDLRSATSTRRGSWFRQRVLEAHARPRRAPPIRTGVFGGSTTAAGASMPLRRSTTSATAAQAPQASAAR
jgi:hypothetical protein